MSKRLTTMVGEAVIKDIHEDDQMTITIDVSYRVRDLFGKKYPMLYIRWQAVKAISRVFLWMIFTR